MKKLLLGLSILFVLLSVVALAYAQEAPNDPSVNEEANACYTGGSMEGLCGTTDHDGNGVVDDYESEWDFRCGWYLIRYQYHMIGSGNMPEDCRSLLEYEASGGCFVEADYITVDLVAGDTYTIYVTDNDCNYNTRYAAFYSLSLLNGSFDFVGWTDPTTLRITIHCVNAGESYSLNGFYGDHNSGPIRVHVAGNCI